MVCTEGSGLSRIRAATWPKMQFASAHGLTRLTRLIGVENAHSTGRKPAAEIIGSANALATSRRAVLELAVGDRRKPNVLRAWARKANMRSQSTLQTKTPPPVGPYGPVPGYGHTYHRPGSKVASDLRPEKARGACVSTLCNRWDSPVVGACVTTALGHLCHARRRFRPRRSKARTTGTAPASGGS